MTKKRTLFISTEEKNKLPILIIDKKGMMGAKFSAKLAEQFLLVLVSGLKFEFTQNTIHIPYSKKIPKIPDNVYSHILVFYNGEKEVLDILPALMKKSRNISAKFIFITSLACATQKFITKLSTHEYLHMQIIIYGEIFQKNGSDNLVNFFLNQAYEHGQIVLPDDVGKLYPVFLEDVFDAIIQEAFSTKFNKKPLLVFPKHPTTELSIARMIKKKNPQIKINFKKYKGKRETYYIPSDGVYFFDEYPLEERLSMVSSSYQPRAKYIKNKKQALPQHKNTKLNLRIIFFSVIGGFLAPIIIGIFVGIIGVAMLYLSVGQIEKGNLKTAFPFAVIASNCLKLSTTIGDQFDTSYTLATTEVELIRALDSWQENFPYSVAVVKNSVITLQKMKAEGKLPRELTKKLADLETILHPIENILDATPYLLGFEGKRNYLVLFQNNMELRPGGGFIGSYGILRLDKGRISEFKVYDVYDADGKLKTHIEPPFAIRRFLGASHWFLRDSNFAIDFPTNAEKATIFLKLETGEQVDGVMAIDTSFIKNILASTGPVMVSDYKETVSADNFYLLTQKHAEENFFPGSTQKKDFLRALLFAMQTKVTEKERLNYFSLAKAVGESIEKKHLFFAFANQPSQKLFAVNNLSSSLVDLREKQENTFLDFLGIIDANLGLNKVNFYLNRSIEQLVTIGKDGIIEETTTIFYKNNSKKNSTFGGEYKNYLRYVLPEGTTLKEIKIDNLKKTIVDAVTDPSVFIQRQNDSELNAKNVLLTEQIEIERGVEQGKNTIGFLLTVPVGQTKKVSLTYVPDYEVDVNSPVFDYDLFLFKQPGTDQDSYSFSLVFPNSFQPVFIDSKLNDVGGKLVYSGVFNKDVNFKVKFGKK